MYFGVMTKNICKTQKKKLENTQLGSQIEKFNFIGISHNKASPDSIYYTVELNWKASRLYLMKLYQKCVISIQWHPPGAQTHVPTAMMNLIFIKFCVYDLFFVSK